MICFLHHRILRMISHCTSSTSLSFFRWFWPWILSSKLELFSWKLTLNPRLHLGSQLPLENSFFFMDLDSNTYQKNSFDVGMKAETTVERKNNVDLIVLLPLFHVDTIIVWTWIEISPVNHKHEKSNHWDHRHRRLTTWWIHHFNKKLQEVKHTKNFSTSRDYKWKVRENEDMNALPVWIPAWLGTEDGEKEWEEEGHEGKTDDGLKFLLPYVCLACIAPRLNHEDHSKNNSSIWRLHVKDIIEPLISFHVRSKWTRKG